LGQDGRLFLSLRSEGGDARDEEPGNNATAAVWPHKRKFYDSPKGETKGMLAALKVYYLLVKTWLIDEHGQDVMEYALLSGGIALAIAAVLLVAPIRDSMANFATAVGNCINLTAAGGYKCP